MARRVAFRTTVLSFLWIALTCSDRAWAGHWYAEYRAGLAAFTSRAYQKAAGHFQAALRMEGSDRPDRYVEGNLHIDYFPHYYLAVSLLHLGRFAEARTEFEIASDSPLSTSLIATLDGFRDELRIRLDAQQTTAPLPLASSRLLRVLDDAVRVSDYRSASQALGELRRTDFAVYARQRLWKQRQVVEEQLFRLDMLAINHDTMQANAEVARRSNQLLAEGRDLERSRDLYRARFKYVEAEDLGGRDARRERIRLDREIEDQRKRLIDRAQHGEREGDYDAALTALQEAQKNEPGSPLLNYNLAVAYAHKRDFAVALDHLDEAAVALGPGPRRDELKEFRAALVTKLQAVEVPQRAAATVNALNRLLRDSNTSFARIGRDVAVGRELCVPLATLSDVTGVASLTFNRARCAALNYDLSEAVTLLRQYLAESNHPTDEELVRDRIVLLESLLALPPTEASRRVQRLYVDVDRFLDKRRLDLALAALQQAAEAMPEFTETTYRLASLNELMGRVDEARSQYETFLRLERNPDRRAVAAARQGQLGTKMATYTARIADSEEPLAQIVAAHLLHGKGAMSYRVRDQLVRIGEDLHSAWTLFPLGARVNELLATMYMLTGQHDLAKASFDVLWSQGLPISFFASDGSGVIISRRGIFLAPSDISITTTRVPSASTFADEPFEEVVSARSGNAGELVIATPKRTIVVVPSSFNLFPRSARGQVLRFFANRHAEIFQRYFDVRVTFASERPLKSEMLMLGWQAAEAAYYLYDLTRVFKFLKTYNALYYGLGTVQSVRTMIEIAQVVRVHKMLDQESMFKHIPTNISRFSIRGRL